MENRFGFPSFPINLVFGIMSAYVKSVLIVTIVSYTKVS